MKKKHRHLFNKCEIYSSCDGGKKCSVWDKKYCSCGAKKKECPERQAGGREMKPSKRIMEIYLEESKAHGAEKLSSLGEGLPAFMQKIYCDSIVQYLDETSRTPNVTES